MAMRHLRVYNNCMRKFKIFVTVFVLYEFAILTILQVYNYCVGIFNVNFCDIGVFKYFLMCIMLPGLVALFIWWMPNIARAVCQRCETLPIKPVDTLHDMLQEIISAKDIERFITAAIIMGVQKFAQTHPKTQTVFDEIVRAIKKTPKR